jgi:hypothetical protein
MDLNTKKCSERDSNTKKCCENDLNVNGLAESCVGAQVDRYANSCADHSVHGQSTVNLRHGYLPHHSVLQRLRLTGDASDGQTSQAGTSGDDIMDEHGYLLPKNSLFPRQLTISLPELLLKDSLCSQYG